MRENGEAQQVSTTLTTKKFQINKKEIDNSQRHENTPPIINMYNVTSKANLRDKK